MHTRVVTRDQTAAAAAAGAAGAAGAARWPRPLALAAADAA